MFTLLEDEFYQKISYPDFGKISKTFILGIALSTLEKLQQEYLVDNTEQET